MRTARDQGNAFIANMRGYGLSATTVAPPLVRLCWMLGWRVPPPVYWKHSEAAIGLGMIPGTALAGMVYVIDLAMRGQASPGWYYLSIAGLSGFVYGMVTAMMVKRVVHKAHIIPSWQSFA